MLKTLIIGNGNVASHFIKAFTKAGTIEATQLDSRKIDTISDYDVIVIAISDDVIATVSEKLKDTTSLVVHTSGTVAMNVLQTKRKGVFYPLQTFTKDKSVDFSKIPFCIEATNATDLQILSTLAKALDVKAYEISTEQRKKLHIAAVFVNNFTNHMYTIGKDICDEHQVPFEILLPLIEETAKKVKELSPKEAQTGPAKRNDIETIQSHLENLNLHQQEIYSLLTKSIQEN
ncbi:MAG: DUF2520 domain-containing protein [Flavobacteriaceae bacterium]|nr:DUF2520 domain-containing protein [Flavobacteriaceae bacterium]